MKFGMTEEQFNILEQLVIQPLKKQNARVFIFGSRTSSKHHSHSDVDVLFQLPESSELSSGVLSQIRENIEESRFPFTVDIVNARELAKSYLPSVESSKIEV